MSSCSIKTVNSKMDYRFEQKWRFLNTGFRNAFFNMALDELIHNSVADGSSPPTIRVFGWTPPAISLGYAQSVEKEVDLEKCRKMGIDLVRRPTGGRAVLHWEELTYSFICREGDIEGGGTISETYRIVGAALVGALRELCLPAEMQRSPVPLVLPRGKGPTAPCFSSAARSEVVVLEKKIAGSAQKRFRGAILQHGSVLLGPAHRRLIDLLNSLSDEVRERFRLSLEENTTSVSEILGRSISFEIVAESIRKSFEDVLKAKVDNGEVSSEEWEEACRLAETKYKNPKWNMT